MNYLVKNTDKNVSDRNEEDNEIEEICTPLSRQTSQIIDERILNIIYCEDSNIIYFLVHQ